MSQVMTSQILVNHMIPLQFIWRKSVQIDRVLHFMGFSYIDQPWEHGLKVPHLGHSWTQASHRVWKNSYNADESVPKLDIWVLKNKDYPVPSLCLSIVQTVGLCSGPNFALLTLP